MGFRVADERNKLTDLWENWLLKNGFKNTLSEINLQLQEQSGVDLLPHADSGFTLQGSGLRVWGLGFGV